MSYVRRNTYSRPPAGGREQRIASNYHDVSSVVPVNYHKKRQLQDFSFDEFYSVLGEPVYGDEPEPIRIKVLTDLLLENVENRTDVDQGKIRTLIDTVRMKRRSVHSCILSDNVFLTLHLFLSVEN